MPGRRALDEPASIIQAGEADASPLVENPSEFAIASPVPSAFSELDQDLDEESSLLPDPQEKYARYFELVDGDGPTQLEELEEIRDILADIMNTHPPVEALEQLTRLIEATDFTTNGMRAMAYSGYHIGSILQNDSGLTPGVYAAFLVDDNEARLTMYANALLTVAGLPPDSSAENQIPEFERDMFTIASHTQNETLQATLLYNIPRAKNSEVTDAAVEWALEALPNNTSMNLMRSVLEVESAQRMAAADSGNLDVKLTDSRKVFSDRLIARALAPPTSEQKLLDAMQALMDLNFIDGLRELRRKLDVNDYRDVVVEILDAEIFRH